MKTKISNFCNFDFYLVILFRLQNPDDRELGRDVEPVRHDRVLRQRDQKDRQLPLPAETQMSPIQQQSYRVRERSQLSLVIKEQT